MRIAAAWNVRSLYKLCTFGSFVTEATVYNFCVIEMPEVRCPDSYRKGNCGKESKNQNLGTVLVEKCLQKLSLLMGECCM